MVAPGRQAESESGVSILRLDRASMARGLQRFDPLPHDPLLRLIDPGPTVVADPLDCGPVRLGRLLAAGGLLLCPLVGLALYVSRDLAGIFVGTRGFAEDHGVLILWLYFMVMCVLVMFARRILGLLILRIEALDIARIDSDW